MLKMIMESIFWMKKGGKIEYTVTYEYYTAPHISREPIYVNDDGHLDTEHRHLVIKDGVDADHAVSKGQLDSMKTQIMTQVNQAVTEAIDQLKTQTSALIIQFINQEIRSRIGRHIMNIPKTNYKSIKLLDIDDIDGVDDLKNVIILNVFIKRKDRNHHSKSDCIYKFGILLQFR